MERFLTILIPAGIAFVALILIGFIAARLYNRSTRGEALVRTGAGGLKVVLDGGAFVIPVLHEVIRINMETIKVVVKREGSDALITMDKLRASATAEFYIRVKPSTEAIASAAQTLGDKTFDDGAISAMIEGKVVGTMRAVSATMSMNDLHEKRDEFVQNVQKSLSEELQANGLMLESVALTSLDQAPQSSLDPTNIFDAVALKIVAQVTKTQERERAAIVAEGDLEIQKSQQAAKIEAYAVTQKEEDARVKQSLALAEIETGEKSRKAELAEEEATATQNAATDREAGVRQRKIDADLEVGRKAQASAIELAGLATEESKAKAGADKARAEAVIAEESIETERETARANRIKSVSIIQAEEEAEREATGITITARANFEAAENAAKATLVGANADADRIKILAEATQVKGDADAAAALALINAENAMSSEVRDMKIQLARIAILPEVIREMMEPVRHIESIRFNHIGGMAGAGGGEGSGTPGTMGPVGDLQGLITGLAVQLPMMKSLGEQVGMSFENGAGGLFEQVAAAKMPPEMAKPVDAAGFAEAVKAPSVVAKPAKTAKGKTSNAASDNIAAE